MSFLTAGRRWGETPCSLPLHPPRFPGRWKRDAPPDVWREGLRIGIDRPKKRRGLPSGEGRALSRFGIISKISKRRNGRSFPTEKGRASIAPRDNKVIRTNVTLEHEPNLIPRPIAVKGDNACHAGQRSALDFSLP
jgi:hypothetical protein